MSADPWTVPSTEPPPLTDLDLIAMTEAELLRERIRLMCYTTPRNLQLSVGWSEIGSECERELAYKGNRAKPVRVSDPLKSGIIGTGAHMVLAEGMARLDQGAGRFLIEHRVMVDGIPGQADFADTIRYNVIDYKTTGKSRIAEYRRKGPRPRFVVQINGYAQGLINQGYRIDYLVLAFIPTDGELKDIWCWVGEPDPELLAGAVARYHAAVEKGKVQGMASVDKTPTALCNYCDYYLPGQPDSDTSCSGGTL